jgi:signal transduction histidine kinase
MPQPLPHDRSARTDAVAGAMPAAEPRDLDAPAADADLAQQLADCRAELAATQRDLELLSHGVSHDLRAPLRAIEGFTALLDQHASPGLDATARDHLARVRAAAARMAALIDGLLALSRAARSPLSMVDVDASLLADWTFAELQDADPTRTAELHVQPGIVVRGDERQLKLLLEQLLGNAWKFSRSRDRIRVSVTAADVGGAVRISVRDHGTGFDPARGARIFEPFQRLHGADEGGGHGLGLAIAQRIAERHGATISVDAVAGEGCTFHVDLPRGSTGIATVADGQGTAP